MLARNHSQCNCTYLEHSIGSINVTETLLFLNDFFILFDPSSGKKFFPTTLIARKHLLEAKVLNGKIASFLQQKKDT